MQLSSRCEYALRALIDLELARESGRDVLPASELTAHENLPVKFLQQILLDMKEGGWVATRRGRSGGYRLAVTADSIFLGDVVRFVDGPLRPLRCVGEGDATDCSCPDDKHCGLRFLMTDVHTAITGVLDRYTLADIVGITVRSLKRDGISLPFRAP